MNDVTLEWHKEQHKKKTEFKYFQLINSLNI